MSNPVAKRGDRVVGLDKHVVLVSTPGGAVPTTIVLPFDGPLRDELSPTVFIDGKALAVVGSRAENAPGHIPIGGVFQRTPSDVGVVARGSATVYADYKAVARAGDPVACCNDPGDEESGHVVAEGRVIAG